jgi:putative component of membrane protein insertase Oxa1/YidC/SpoIIIJ protein YidD
MDFFLGLIRTVATGKELPLYLEKVATPISLLAIRLYQVFISSWRKRDCYFNPSCSVWTANNIRSMGFNLGIRASYIHICHCGGSHAIVMGENHQVNLICDDGVVYKESDLSNYIIRQLKRDEFTA